MFGYFLFFIGFAKCGTTDLFMRLQDHHQIVNGLKKEIHFWSEAHWGMCLEKKHKYTVISRASAPCKS